MTRRIRLLLLALAVLLPDAAEPVFVRADEREQLAPAPRPIGPAPVPAPAGPLPVADGPVPCGEACGTVLEAPCRQASWLSRIFPRKKRAKASVPPAVAAQHSGCNVHPEPPFGASYQALMHTQAANGEAALMVLYQFDFVPGEATLTPRGRMRLHRIAGMLARNPFPLVIEPGPAGPFLDEARRAEVGHELQLLAFAVPEERIVVGYPGSRGLDGIDAEILHQKLLGLTAAGTTAAGAPPAEQQVVIPAAP